MAGRRQHYIPRLLQRGFLNDPSDEAERTWLHRRNAVPRLVGISDVGVEEWFYSRKSLDGSPTLDDAITDIERDLGPSVSALRVSAPGSSIVAEEAARTVVHLVMRTAHLRRIMTAGLSGITNEIESIFSDPMRLGGMLDLKGPTLPPIAFDAIRESGAELARAGIPAAFSERLMAFELREVGGLFVQQAAATLAPLLPTLFNELMIKVRESHNSILATSSESNGWLTALAALEWTVEVGVDLILPDAVALACEDHGLLMPLLFTKAADVRVVVMPVSPCRILVGRMVGGASIDLGRFNSDAAASCEAFFISAKPDKDNSLSALIGSASAREIEETVIAAIRDAEKMRSATDIVPAWAQPRTFVESGVSYGVRLVDFGDEVLAKEFAELLRGVVNALIPNPWNRDSFDIPKSSRL